MINQIPNARAISEINELPEALLQILIKEAKGRDLTARREKQKRILLLLAKGVALMTVLVAPNAGRLLRPFLKDRSDWEEWKIFNDRYLRQSIRRLEKSKVVEIIEQDGANLVTITQKGKRKVLKMAVESLTISRPGHWDGKWRLVFYDVSRSQSVTRDRLRRYLKNAGFYPLQESVFLHAYPCEVEIEALRNYLGIASDVRIAVVDQIENDDLFRKYFAV